MVETIPALAAVDSNLKDGLFNKSGAVLQTYRSAERDSALAKLMRFSARDEYNERHKAALELFWGEWLSVEPDDELDEVIKSEQVNLAYHS